MAEDAPRLDGVRFAVLALGDTAYVNFCPTGKQIDARLEALGGTRAADRVDLDLDYAKQAAAWTDKTLEVSRRPTRRPRRRSCMWISRAAFRARTISDEPLFTADNPARRRDFRARQSQRHGLDARNVARGVRRRRTPGFIYQARRRDRPFAGKRSGHSRSEVLAAVGLDGDAALRVEARAALRRHDAVASARRGLREAHGPQGCGGAADGGWRCSQFTEDRQLVDLFETYPEKLTGEQLIEAAAAVAGPALFGRLEPQGASGRSTPSGRRRALGVARQAAQGRDVHVPRRPAPGRRPRQDLRPAQPAFRPSGRWPAARSS